MEEKLLGRLVRLNTAYGMCELFAVAGPCTWLLHTPLSCNTRCVRGAVSDHKEDGNPVWKRADHLLNRGEGDGIKKAEKTPTDFHPGRAGTCPGGGLGSGPEVNFEHIISDDVLTF